MATLGLILVIAAGIGTLICWVKMLISAFQQGDTLWGVLGIIFPVMGLIWLFLNDEKRLGFSWIGASVLVYVGLAMSAE